METVTIGYVSRAKKGRMLVTTDAELAPFVNQHPMNVLLDVINQPLLWEHGAKEITIIPATYVDERKRRRGPANSAGESAGEV
jgi:hypothetical protein